LVEHTYALRSKGKLILEDSDRLRDKEKQIPNNAKWLLGNTDWLLGKTESEPGRTESELGKTETSSGKEKLVLVTQVSYWVMLTSYQEKQIWKQSQVWVRQNRG
jgi:hypothetical protein